MAGLTSTVAADEMLTAPAGTYQSTPVPVTWEPAANASPAQNTCRPGWNATAVVIDTAEWYTVSASALVIDPMVGFPAPGMHTAAGGTSAP